MFLCLTAIAKLWKENEDLIFLGDWCFNTEEDLKNNKSKIIKYPWNDLLKVKKDGEIIYRIYKKFMPILANKLNKIHNQNLPIRYWEILVGVWYYRFIEVFYERYLLINQVKDKSNLSTFVSKKFFPPNTFIEFYTLSQNDSFNFSLFSEVLKNLNHKINLIYIDYDFYNQEYFIDNKFDFKNYKYVKKYENIFILKKVLNFFNNKIIYYKDLLFNKFIFLIQLYIRYYFFNFFKKNNLVFFDYGLAISKKESQKIYFHLKQLPLKKNKKVLPEDKKNIFDMNLRSQSITNENFDEFEHILANSTLKFIPNEYLENYKYLRNFIIKKLLPKKFPKMIGIRSSLESKSVPRFITAEFFLHDTKIFCTQEGGGANVRMFNPLEENINYIGCDYFSTWGWVPKNTNSFQSYMTKTFWLKNFDYKKNGHILLVGGSCRKYHWSIYEGNLLKYKENHIKINIDLLSKLNPKIRNNLIYRFHVQHGKNEFKEVLKSVPDIKISLREDNIDFYNLFYNSKIIINTSDYTANLQSFLANIPSLWIWDKDYNKIREESKKYYEALEDSKILHYDVNNFINHFNKIYNDPMSWWLSENVQQAKNYFCDNFCKKTENIDKEIIRIIEKIT